MVQSAQEFNQLRRRILQKEFSRMNAPQQQAVFHTDGALLLLAGAGSGKTTVLINRIANLIRYGNAYHDTGMPDNLTDNDWQHLQACADGAPVDDRVISLCAVDPCPAWRIMAITFTNKAAGELKDRLARMLGDEGNEVMASTFHSLCARILRTDGRYLGYSAHFVIYDTDDSRKLMKDCMKSINLDEKTLGHKVILNEIGRAKDRLLNPQDFAAEAGSDFRLKKAAECYAIYQKRLQEADAMDFDDLLCNTVKLFRQFPEVLRKYQQRYQYIMVDEYQDTNHAQYQFVSLLAGGYGNLCVVGDDDQSIYKFRGASIENILNFENEFSHCTVIRLEQNYRSTQNILNAANEVIKKNENRKGKTLWTQNAAGNALQQYALENEDEEGRFIADTILDKVADDHRKYGDFAVLYRANAQSNAIERSLIKSGVPYRIIGGHRFNDTKEVKDAVAYLRIINNPRDTVSLRRVINEPKRGIGDTTMDNAMALALESNQSLYDILLHADEYAAISRAAAKIKSFTDIIENLRTMNEDPDVSVHLLYRTMLDSSGYLAMWEAAGQEESARIDNLNELASSILNYEQNSEDDLPDLAGFLEENALLTDIDNYDGEADAVVLMTMHAAKGLEFPVVFLPGFEDGIFPGLQTMFDPSELEEDRRLCYVAITRAKEELYITNAKSRMLYGMTNRNRPSCFLNDIPPELIDMHDKTVTHTPHYGDSDSFHNYAGRSSSSSSASFHASFGETPANAQPLFRQPGIRHSVSSAGGGVSAAQKTKTDNTRWSVGDRVSHKVFGEGAIQAVTPMGNDTLLTIAFNAGTKKLMANFAKLKKMQ